MHEQGIDRQVLPEWEFKKVHALFMHVYSPLYICINRVITGIPSCTGRTLATYINSACID
jgi:hypothetical protein